MNQSDVLSSFLNRKKTLAEIVEEYVIEEYMSTDNNSLSGMAMELFLERL